MIGPRSESSGASKARIASDLGLLDGFKNQSPCFFIGAFVHACRRPLRPTLFRPMPRRRLSAPDDGAGSVRLPGDRGPGSDAGEPARVRRSAAVAASPVRRASPSAVPLIHGRPALPPGAGRPGHSAQCLALPLAGGIALADTSGKKIALSNNYAGNSWRQAMLRSWDKVTKEAVNTGIVAAADPFTTAA